MRSSRHRRRRSHKLLAALIIILVIAGIGGGADLGYHFLKSQADQLQARLTLDLQAGQTELEAGKAALTQANADHDAYWALRANDHFTAAKAQFLAAGGLADNSQLLQWLERTPGVSDLAHSRHMAVDGIARMGTAISDAGQGLSQLDGEILKPTSSGEAGRTLLTVLDSVHTGLASVRADLQTAQHAAAQVDLSVVPAGQLATFLKARASIDSALAGFAEFERLFPVLTEVLGGNGTRRYLVEQVNSAELRAGGGFIGTYSLLQAAQGSISVVRSGDSYELADPRPLPGQAGFIPEPGPFREIIPNISWSFVDSNDSPDFPTSAQDAENFAQPRIGKIDAVISIDLYAVAKMLELTGPMAVPGYGITVSASNFVAEAVRLDLGSAQHKTILDALAGPLMSKVASLPPDRWPSLITALNDLALQRHLQAYFNDASVEAEMDRVGWSGRVNPSGSADFMMQVESNYAGGKADYFLVRHYTLALTRSDSVLHHRLTIDYTNNYPAYVGSFLTYIATSRLLLGSNAVALSDNLRPARYPYPSPPAGTKAMSGWLPIIYCCGGRGQAVFTYDTPWPANDTSGLGIYWQKQPGTEADSVTVTWNYGNGQTYRASGNLAQDMLVTLLPNTVTLTSGRAAQATLPSLSF